MALLWSTLATLSLLVVVHMTTGQHLLSLRPLRQVVLVGQDLTLTCTSMGTQANIEWTHVNLEGGSIVKVARGHQMLVPQVSGSSRTHSVVISESNGHIVSELTIQNVALRDSGIYKCKDLYEPTFGVKDSDIVVLGSEPLCSTSPVLPVENDTVNMTCQIECSGRWRPTMQWSGPSVLQSNTQFQSSGTMVTTSLTIVATMDKNKDQFACRTFFKVPKADPLSYNFLHHFEPLDLQHSPRDLMVDPMKEVYRPGDLVICGAGGKPHPSYEWRDDESLDRCQGATLLITEAMEGHRSYSCVATSTIRNQVYHARMTVKLFVHRSNGSTNAQQSAPSRAKSLCIMPVHDTTAAVPVTEFIPIPVTDQELTKGKEDHGAETTHLPKESMTQASPQGLWTSKGSFNQILILPLAVAAVVLFVGIVIGGIFCAMRKKKSNKFHMGGPLHLNNDIYLRTCGDARGVAVMAQPNQYASARRVNVGEAGAALPLQWDTHEEKGEDFDDGSSGFYSELVVPEDQSSGCNGAPDPPALRADSNCNVTHVPSRMDSFEGEDGYLMPQMDCSNFGNH